MRLTSVAVTDIRDESPREMRPRRVGENLEIQQGSIDL
jgi:hypothetical protein